MAVLAVVLFHAGVPFVPGGFVGVDVFFVISGYLIARIIRSELEEGTFSLAGFYERRARRILPALVVLIAVALLAGWIILLPPDFDRLAASALAALFSVSNFWFWRETNNYFAPDNDQTPLLHTWSLGVEEQFYLVVPLLLMAVFRWRRNWLPAIALLSVAVLFVGGAYIASTRPAAAFYLVPFRAWELGIGVLLAVVPFPLLRSRWLREAAAAAGLGAILVAVLVYTGSTPFPGVTALLPTLGAAALIHAGSSGDSIAGRLLSVGPMVLVGLISYSLYLWHWPILAFLKLFLMRGDLTPAETAAAVAASFVVAAISWCFVERPFRRRTRLSRDGVLWTSLGSVGVLAAISVAVMAGSGLPGRFSAELQPIMAMLDDAQGLDERCSTGVLADDGPCRLGADGISPTVLLWGDSHAGSIRAPLDAAARLAGVAGYWVWYSSCPATLGLLQVTKGGCEDFNGRVLGELRSHPTITTVILAGRWARWHANDARLPGEQGPPIPDHIDDPALPGAPGPEGVVAFGLRQMVDVLRQDGYEVVLIGTTPEFAAEVPVALMAERRWGIPFVPTDAAGYAERNRAILPLFEDLGRLPGVTYVPIHDVLCPDECTVILDGIPVYRDRDHLSAYGGTTLLADALAERIWGVTAP